MRGSQGFFFTGSNGEKSSSLLITRALAEIDRPFTDRVGRHGEALDLHVGFIHEKRVIGGFERHPQYALIHAQ